MLVGNPPVKHNAGRDPIEGNKQYCKSCKHRPAACSAAFYLSESSMTNFLKSAQSFSLLWPFIFSLWFGLQHNLPGLWNGRDKWILMIICKQWTRPLKCMLLNVKETRLSCTKRKMSPRLFVFAPRRDNIWRLLLTKTWTDSQNNTNYPSVPVVSPSPSARLGVCVWARERAYVVCI